MASTGKDIKYTNRDYDSIVNDLLNVIKQSYPDFGNFGEHSSSRMLVELMAYLADTHNFQIDAYYKEMFLDTAVEKKNLIRLAELLSYKYKGKTESIADLDIQILVPYITQDGIRIPDSRYFLTVERGTVFKSNTSPVQYFEVIEDCDFSTAIDSEISIAEREDPNDPDSAVTQYAITKTVKAVNGKRKTEVIAVGDYVPFLEIPLTQIDILDVVSVVDGSGNPYQEVDYLAQDAVFVITKNTATGDELAQVPYIVDLQQVSRRFIKKVDENNLTTLTFGAGSENVSDSTLVPNPYQFVLSTTSYAGNVIDPNNFLSTSTLGISPNNTNMTIIYRYGGGTASNVPANSIIQKDNIIFHFPTNDILVDKNAVYQSISANNLQPAQGGIDELSVEELRQFASESFASQRRAVTLNDYTALIYTMPSNFGAVYRVHAESSTAGDNTINLYALALDENGDLVAPYTSLINNIKTFLEPYKMLNDALYIQAGNVINVGLSFEVVISDSYNKSSVLFEIIGALKTEFATQNMAFNRPIIISKVYDIIHNSLGVISASNVLFTNLVGTLNGRTYSSYEHNLINNTKNGIIYSNSESIFEIKYEDIDIRGTIISK